MAPELHHEKIDDLSKVDTWAAAVVLINMLTGGKFVDKENLNSSFCDK